MANIGSKGVVDYTNTTSASATGVVATGGIGDRTVCAYPVPPTTKFLVTLNSYYITTLAGAYLVTK